ncbi:MAG: hypothetical protein GC171_06840 [Terrimonas sp.]|nr:hypothetical protein [Terrimonas sp.]
MKFFVATLLTALLAFIGGLKFDWWIIALAGFLVAVLVHQKAGKAFLSGFTGLFLLHGILAFWINKENDGILATKVAMLLPLGGHPYLLILVTAFIGGLVAGIAALSGSYLRKSH